jgi:hypothetical protein
VRPVLRVPRLVLAFSTEAYFYLLPAGIPMGCGGKYEAKPPEALRAAASVGNVFILTTPGRGVK